MVGPHSWELAILKGAYPNSLLQFASAVPPPRRIASLFSVVLPVREWGHPPPPGRISRIGGYIHDENAAQGDLFPGGNEPFVNVSADFVGVAPDVTQWRWIAYHRLCQA